MVKAGEAIQVIDYHDKRRVPFQAVASRDATWDEDCDCWEVEFRDGVEHENFYDPRERHGYTGIAVWSEGDDYWEVADGTTCLSCYDTCIT